MIEQVKLVSFFSEGLTAVAATGAVIVSLVAMNFAKGNSEIMVYNACVDSRKYYDEALKNHAKNRVEFGEELADVLRLEALEIYLNSYDLACSLYLDGKLDKKRFVKTYKNEIRRLLERYSDKIDANSSLRIADRRWQNKERKRIN